MHIVKTIALAVLMLALAVGTSAVSEAATWDGGTIRVVGLGIPPADTNGAQAEAMTRRAAIADAYRQLAEQVGVINVDAVTTVENLMLINTTVHTRVSALIKGAVIVEEKEQPGGSYTVTLELPVYGIGSLASTVFAPNKTPEPWSSPASVYAPYQPQTYDTTGYGTYDRAQSQSTSANSQASAPTPLRSTAPDVTANPLRPSHPVVTTPAAPTRPTHPTAPAPTAPAPAPVVQPPAPAPTVQTPAPAPAVQTPAAPTEQPPAPAATVQTPPPAPAVQTPAAPTTPPAEIVPTGTAVGGYTGVIIDCTGLGLRPVMSPVIKAENGRPIYGYKNLDSDKVVQNGMASYARSEADTTRAGANPLRLRAVSVDSSANPVLSAKDANRLLLENSASGFLDATNVVFLR